MLRSRIRSGQRRRAPKGEHARRAVKVGSNLIPGATLRSCAMRFDFAAADRANIAGSFTVSRTCEPCDLKPETADPCLPDPVRTRATPD
jgi:hypothetical protein